MLDAVDASSLEELAKSALPESIYLQETPEILGHAATEQGALSELREKASKNKVETWLLGGGYYRSILPPVIQRNVLENPGWYTQYTPYQSEIAQGRLEALLNFQTMVADLTGLPVANSSMLDEATAAAEAMAMAFAAKRKKRTKFFVESNVHEATRSVLQTRADSMGMELVVGGREELETIDDSFCGALLQYPDSLGGVAPLGEAIDTIHDNGALAVVATDLLALTLLREPGADGADICVGSTQRFGLPLGFGGPHAGFLATTEKHQRRIPGRIVGVSVDADGRPGYRLAIQTREQHIRRERATSNICTAQVLPAVIASMYAVYHGPDGLQAIARRVRRLAQTFKKLVEENGYRALKDKVFDTVSFSVKNANEVQEALRGQGLHVRAEKDSTIVVSFDEATTIEEFERLCSALELDGDIEEVAHEVDVGFSASLERKSDYLTHPVFHSYQTEHEMLRYLHRLQGRDLSLTTSMIPLGSCTMKLNATAEMMPITWSEFSDIHPHAPASCWQGYREMLDELGEWLARTTGMDAVSLQPNAGSQGEYAGLLSIRRFHESRGDDQRDICLIPTSAHGTNPASAVIAGYKVVSVACDDAGNIDVDDLREKTEKYQDRVAALMITYPSTHGVFEETVKEVCEVVHGAGGQVYLDGANMNAQVGLCRPADYGADVCHLNLHKTFCIPHGGGGPGMGPIAAREHLAPFMPGKPHRREESEGAVSATEFGSALILAISWMYMRMMGDDGLRRATEVAILNANYMCQRLADHYPILYRGKNGRVAHEFIVDFRQFKKSAGIEVEDVAKRLMDYGFHAPTMSFPVPGTLMVEPTESESLAELDRFCDALIEIRKEIAEIEEGRADDTNNVLKHAPHPAATLITDAWDRPYSREQAAYPLDWVKDAKFWPAVSRIDNGYGDRNLFCTCPEPGELEMDAAE
jgi:glycine dehydrogenase